MKPIVTYRSAYYGPFVGQSAIINDLEGHPSQASGEMEGVMVKTSRVLKVEDDGTFETMNTIYRKR